MLRETFNRIEEHIDSDSDLEELQEKMNTITHETAKEFYKLKSESMRITECLEKNFNKYHLSDHFDIHELIEERIDEFIHQYAKIKKYLKDGREVRCYIEKKGNQKSNELRYATHLESKCVKKPNEYK
jgi:predicted nuclease with TOPRIM domain